MIARSAAIVLRKVDFKESSLIVTFFTREHGKIAVMVHGAKKPKSKLSGLIEVGNLLEIVYYFKETRSVQTLKEASSLVNTPQIRRDFEKMATVSSVIELITQLLQDGEVNEELFRFTRRFVEWLEETEYDPGTVFPYVQIRLAELMGIQLQLDMGITEDNIYFNLENGTIEEDKYGSVSYKLTKNQYKYIKLALSERNYSLFTIPFENSELKSLIQYLDNYFKFHLEGIKDRTSDAIFEQIL